MAIDCLERGLQPEPTPRHKSGKRSSEDRAFAKVWEQLGKIDNQLDHLGAATGVGEEEPPPPAEPDAAVPVGSPEAEDQGAAEAPRCRVPGLVVLTLSGAQVCEFGADDEALPATVRDLKILLGGLRGHLPLALALALDLRILDDAVELASLLREAGREVAGDEEGPLPPVLLTMISKEKGRRSFSTVWDNLGELAKTVRGAAAAGLDVRWPSGGGDETAEAEAAEGLLASHDAGARSSAQGLGAPALCSEKNSELAEAGVLDGVSMVHAAALPAGCGRFSEVWAHLACLDDQLGSLRTVASENSAPPL